MKVHVTGASGFIGRNLVPRLLKEGHELTQVIANADAVVHLAGIAHRRASRDELLEANVRLTERLARQAADAGARFVFISSVKVHGEESSRPFKEDSPIAPEDPYAESKARAEEALRSIAGLRLTVLRPPLVYGPGVKANFLSLMRAVAAGLPLPFASIRNRRSLVYVGNLAGAIIACGTSEQASSTYLISDGDAVSTPELCRCLGKAMGRPARLLPFPSIFLPRNICNSLEVDDSAIRGSVGWQPQFSRDEALKVTADWYRGR